MSKYRFRLETLLKLRRSARDAQRLRLAEAAEAETIVRKRREEMEQQIAQLKHRSRRAAMKGVVQVDQLIEIQRYEMVLRSDSEVLGEQHTLLAQEVERRQASLVQADRDVRILEKLQEKQYVRHRKQMTRRELKQLDEVGSRRATEESAW